MVCYKSIPLPCNYLLLVADTVVSLYPGVYVNLKLRKTKCSQQRGIT